MWGARGSPGMQKPQAWGGSEPSAVPARIRGDVLEPSLLCDSPGDTAPEASSHSSACAVTLAVIPPSQRSWHTPCGDTMDRTGLLGANNEGKSDDNTPNPHSRAEQRQPHITSAPGREGSQIPTAPAEPVAKCPKFSSWPRTANISPHSSHRNLELKMSPKNIPAAALMPLES